MCIRDRYQRRVRGNLSITNGPAHLCEGTDHEMSACHANPGLTNACFTQRMSFANGTGPLKYLLQKMGQLGLPQKPMHFAQQTVIRNATHRTADSVLYTSEMLKKVETCSIADMPALLREYPIAHSQNRTGETMLMKIVRRALSADHHHTSDSVGYLLRAGSEPLACCGAGKNVIHDLFWSTYPSGPEDGVLETMKTIFLDLLHFTGRDGMLSLLLCQDKNASTAVEYLKPFHTNWQTLLDLACSFERAEPLEMKSPAPLIAPSTIEVVNMSALLRLVDHGDQRLLVWCLEHEMSFLLSDAQDPEAKVVYASHNFSKVTGYSQEEVIGQNCRFLQGADTCFQMVDQIRYAIKSCTTTLVEIINYKKNGERFLNKFMLTPLCTPSGEVLYFAGIQDCSLEIESMRCEASSSVESTTSGPNRLILKPFSVPGGEVLHFGMTGDARTGEDSPIKIDEKRCEDSSSTELTDIPSLPPSMLGIATGKTPQRSKHKVLESLAGIGERSSKKIKPVSYTHLTLPTKRIV
eukprot:TRINITY_DN92_c0_g2_i1.p1 TRINITY_DN92_c0_g2~~TRINITY_DN92_c0_g2_i1.p1  ORF type:complete len:522 (-),score=41.02 TRINITY_DN92_c0_g2_i1:41-1606(-)